MAYAAIAVIVTTTTIANIESSYYVPRLLQALDIQLYEESTIIISNGRK